MPGGDGPKGAPGGRPRGHVDQGAVGPPGAGQLIGLEVVGGQGESLAYGGRLGHPAGAGHGEKTAVRHGHRRR
jgi:hypothetical protein